MSTTVALLLLAVQLLTAVQQAPNIPDSLRESAITLAQQIIIASQAQGIEATSSPSYTVPVYLIVQQPTYGTTQPSTPMTQTEPKLIVSLANKGASDAANDMPYGDYTYEVSYVDASGTYLKDAMVHMDAPDNVLASEPNVNKKTNSLKGEDKAKWYANFAYTPNKPGEKAITFTANGISQIVTVDVQ